jgi:hypothetical protein
MFNAIDVSFQLTEAQYAAILASGRSHIFRYLAQNAAKAISHDEVIAAHNAGCQLGFVYEDSPLSIAYFSAERGTADATRAVQQLTDCGAPLKGGIHVFSSVDYDATASALHAIQDYQAAFQAVLKPAGFLASVYANGMVCQALVGAGLAHSGWLSGSRLWTGSQAYAASGLWAVHQTTENGSIETSAGTISCDLDVVVENFDGMW